MAEQKKGIAFCGTMLLDLVKDIHAYPEVGMLVDITNVGRAVGGSVPNTGINLMKIDSQSVPVSAIGRIGDDDNGRYVVKRLKDFGIDTKKISVSPTAPTGFSDVMSLPSGDRTFFLARGANAEMDIQDVDVAALDCSIFHFGYILLMDRFDAKDPEYGTVLARLLSQVQARGIKTSIDMVSNNSGGFQETVRPVLKYTNYMIVNEIESCAIWDLEPRKADGSIDLDNVKEAMRLMAKAGVKDKVIVHSKEIGICLDVQSGEFTVVPSLKIPKEKIKGSVGAGDSYCAACLYGLYHDYDDRALLEFASAAAACNLFAENSIDGMRSKEGIMQMMQEYERLPL